MIDPPLTNHRDISVGKEAVAGRPESVARRGRFLADRIEERGIVQIGIGAPERPIFVVEFQRPVARAFRLRIRNVVKERRPDRRAEMFWEKAVELVIGQREEVLDGTRRHVVDKITLIRDAYEKEDFPHAFRNVPRYRSVGGDMLADIDAFKRLHVHRDRSLKNALGLAVKSLFGKRDRRFFGEFRGTFNLPFGFVEAFERRVGKLLLETSAGGPARKIDVVVKNHPHSKLVGKVKRLAILRQILVRQIFRRRLGQRQERDSAKAVALTDLKNFVNNLVGQFSVRMPERQTFKRHFTVVKNRRRFMEPDLEGRRVSVDRARTKRLLLKRFRLRGIRFKGADR